MIICVKRLRCFINATFKSNFSSITYNYFHRYLFSLFLYCTFRPNFRKLAEIPDKILLACKKGDKKAQEVLYRLVSPRMYGLCLHYAGNDEDARDILQDGFIKVFEKIYQFEGKGSFEGWIRRIMINTAIGMLRNKIRLQSLDEATVSFEKEIYNENILDDISAEELISVIRELSPAYRTVFNLYAIEGYSHKEIGEILGISEGASKSNLSRARQILQKKLNTIRSSTDRKMNNE